MSFPADDQPFADEDEDLRRKAEIEDMMRWQRDSYFRDEPLQQEYRDVVTRLADRADARRNANATDVREPGPFDLALQRFQESRPALVEGTELAANAQDLDNPISVREARAGTPAGFDPSLSIASNRQPTRLLNSSVQPLQNVNAVNPIRDLGEWIMDFKKYAGEVDQYANSSGIKGTVIFHGRPVDTDQQANNAFAHAAMSALYAYDKGTDASKFAGNAREMQNHIDDSAYHASRRLKDFLSGRSGDLLEDEKERSRKLDTYKDLFNNSIGRKIGEAAKAAGVPRSQVLDEVLEALKTGKLISDEFVDPRVDKKFDGNPFRYRPPIEQK